MLTGKRVDQLLAVRFESPENAHRSARSSSGAGGIAPPCWRSGDRNPAFDCGKEIADFVDAHNFVAGPRQFSISKSLRRGFFRPIRIQLPWPSPLAA
jgi:hypothetical protein